MRIRLPLATARQCLQDRARLKLTSHFGAPVNSKYDESALCHYQQRTCRLNTAFPFTVMLDTVTQPRGAGGDVMLFSGKLGLFQYHEFFLRTWYQS